jgi:hypothetical protein
VNADYTPHVINKQGEASGAASRVQKQGNWTSHQRYAEAPGLTLQVLVVSKKGMHHGQMILYWANTIPQTLLRVQYKFKWGPQRGVLAKSCKKPKPYHNDEKCVPMHML